MTRIITTAICTFALTPLTAAAEVTESRNWTESFSVNAASPRLDIDNIWGSVRVRPGPDGEITVRVDERRTAPDQGLFDRSQELLKLDTFSDAAGVSIVVGNSERWERHNHCPGCRVDYQFDVTVPKSATVNVATVIDGSIAVSGIDGGVSASNVNGPIAVDSLKACASVESVNGSVELSFVSAPLNECRIVTVNGDVTLAMPPGSGVDVSLDLFNGDIESEFAVDTFVATPEVHHEQEAGRNRYRIQQSAGLRLAGGGPLISISSLNGDVRFRQN